MTLLSMTLTLPGMARMSHLRLIFLGFMQPRILNSFLLPILFGIFLSDFYHRLLIRGLIMRMGRQAITSDNIISF
jgi:hypothetical protein